MQVIFANATEDLPVVIEDPFVVNTDESSSSNDSCDDDCQRLEPANMPELVELNIGLSASQKNKDELPQEPVSGACLCFGLCWVEVL